MKLKGVAFSSGFIAMLKDEDYALDSDSSEDA